MKFKIVRLLRFRIPLIYVLLALVSINFAFQRLHKARGIAALEGPSASQPAADTYYLENDRPKLVLKAQEHWVHPVFFAENEEQEARFSGLKQDIQQIIEQYRIAQGVEQVAVMYTELNTGKWFGIAEDVMFKPGSLMKIATALTVMRKEEEQPGFLKETIFFDPQRDLHIQQTLKVAPIQPGQTYNASTLLRHMMVHSDNNATLLLNYMCGMEALRKTYRDLSIPMPDGEGYTITCHEFARFFCVLYNGTYLSRESSESLLGLLAQCDFTEGFAQQPIHVRNARKFGERSYAGSEELHEFGIFYAGNQPYMLGVMTKGKSRVALGKLLAEIAQRIALPTV